jgi:hypothetical protein
LAFMSVVEVRWRTSFATPASAAVERLVSARMPLRMMMRSR